MFELDLNGVKLELISHDEKKESVTRHTIIVFSILKKNCTWGIVTFFCVLKTKESTKN